MGTPLCCALNPIDKEAAGCRVDVHYTPVSDQRSMEQAKEPLSPPLDVQTLQCL